MPWRADTGTGWLAAVSSPMAGPLPEDLLVDARRRVRLAAQAFAVIWAVVIGLVTLLRATAGGAATGEGVWPWPGDGFALLGLGSSQAMAWYASRRSGSPERVLQAAMVHLVVNSALLGLLHNWHPPADPVGISPICLILPIYPAMAPIAVGMSLVAGLAAAAMDPLAYLVAMVRGVAPDRSIMQQVEAFAPTFIAAGVSVYIGSVVRHLGQEVREAREVGSYRLGELIGKGGMGEVYRATHRLLARPAAVKIITPARLKGESEEGRNRARERFRREAAVAAALTSPHTIELFDFGTAPDGSYYYVMELLRGMDLQAMVDRHGPLPPARAIHFLQQACRSLAEAHQLGLVHRDLKPSNLFVTRLGLEADFLKVLDFGVVKLGAGSGPAGPLLTREDIPLGTPAYMAPEGVEGGLVLTPRSDVYSLGCVAFFLLTGELLFHRGSLLQMASAHVHDAPRAPREVQGEPIPAALDALVLQCVAKPPQDRPADASALLASLDLLAAAHPWSPVEATEWWRNQAPPRTADPPA